MPDIQPTMEPPLASLKAALVVHLETAAFFDSLSVYPDDAPDQAQPPDIVVFGTSDPEMMHEGAPVWRVGIAVILTLPRDTDPDDVADYQGNLRKVLLDKIDAADPEITIRHPLAGRLTTLAAAQVPAIPLHVWDIEEGRQRVDIEDNGDHAITVLFTAVACTLAP